MLTGKQRAKRKRRTKRRATLYSVTEFIEAVEADSRHWEAFPWFRGETDDPKDGAENKSPLLPRLFRVTEDGREHNENRLLQNFRLKAPTLGLREIPAREDTDQWLFLAQHFGLPTRLLDWTESALAALYFALQEDAPVVWMLNPIELNNLSLPKEGRRTDYVFPLTWLGHENRPVQKHDLAQIEIHTTLGRKKTAISRIAAPPGFYVAMNIGNKNIRLAWEPGNRQVGTRLPVAILPTNIHPRMSVQKSCFTIHGTEQKPMSDLLRGRHILRKYRISARERHAMLKALRLLGVSHSTLFPDLEGLATELRELF